MSESPFQSNFDFLTKKIEDQAPIERIVAAFVTLFIGMEEYLGEENIPARNKPRWRDAVETFVIYLRVIDQIVPGLYLEGNCAFMERSARSGFPVSGQINFFVRTLDGIRAPLSEFAFTPEQAAQCYEALGDIEKSARLMESCLPEKS